MKVLEKILLMIILIVTINFCIMPITVNAGTTASEELSGIDNDAKEAEKRAKDYLDSHGISLASILDAISWPATIVWIIFLTVVVVFGWLRMWPVILGTVTGRGEAGAWNQIIIYLVLVIAAFVILLRLFPLIVSTSW